MSIDTEWSLRPLAVEIPLFVSGCARLALTCNCSALRLPLAMVFAPSREKGLFPAWTMRCARIVLVGLFFSSPMYVCPLFASVTLQIPDVNLPDGKVEFRPGSCDPTTVPASLPPQMPQYTTPNYTVTVDLGNTTHGNYGYFIYPVYVHPNNGQGKGCGFRVQVLPSGTFVDKMQDVTLRVGEGAQLEDALVRIPLYNFVYAKSILQGHAGDQLSPVSLSGITTLSVTLNNTLADLPIGLYPDVTVSPAHGSYWQGTPQAAVHIPRSNSTELDAGQTLDGAVVLNLRPNSWHALGASIFPLAPGKAHETLTLYVSYDSPGGVPGTLEIPVAIRFTPSFWSLILFVFAGAIAGSLLAQLSKTTGDRRKCYAAFAVALLSAGIAEVLGIVLVYGGSEFRLFGFELDPYQLLPVGAVGALVGLIGFRNADDFLKLFKAKQS
jgi:hypothetical protein